MAYLKKPVIYYQFDKKDFFCNHYKHGYFNYKDNGFGPIVEEEEKLLVFLKVFLKNGCKLSHKYLNRISNTFPYFDNHNCHRIYNVILSSEKV
ncbi:capsular biosynthesis protein, partial [Campylobacter lari]|nr:capsular biosynthesis protein [Campylobacter lari]